MEKSLLELHSMILYGILKQIKMSLTAREHVRERITKMLIRPLC